MNLVLVALVTIHFKPFKIMGWCFDFLTGILWATRHRGEGMPRCKMSHDATATRLGSWRSIRRVLGLGSPPALHFRHCGDDGIACRP